MLVWVWCSMQWKHSESWFVDTGAEQRSVIGIVGGMGPQAGLDLVSKVLEHTVAERDQEHLPLVLMSLPGDIPDRTEFLLGTEPRNPAEAIAPLLLQLEQLGATVAGIPCNTTHSRPIFGRIQELLASAGSRLRVLNMLTETVRYARELLPARCPIGLLSTYGSHRLGVHRDAMHDAFPLVTLTNEEVVELVHRAIYDTQWGLKARPYPASAQAVECLMDACQRLQARGARALMVGCTELPFALPQPEVCGMPIIDPAVALARALIREVRPARLKPLACGVDAQRGSLSELIASDGLELYGGFR
jgi:aspartate racemase